MDGYALARAIRAEELPGSHLPIVAVSADAFRDTEARALAAGIDVYLAKPVQLQRLGTTLEACLVQARAALGPALPLAIVVRGDSATLDPSALRSLVGDEEKMIVDFLGDFLRSLPRLDRELRALTLARDRSRIAPFVHRLKSSSRAMGAAALGGVCAELESAVHASTDADLAPLAEAVHIAMGEAARAIEEYIELFDASTTI
jgi:CheY-like chemotaxis protein